MVQPFKCRLGYGNDPSKVGRRLRLCDCVSNLRTRWTYNCKVLKEKEMGILKDNKTETSFLAKDDCRAPGKGGGLLATITNFTMADLSKGGTPEMKPILHTKEYSPMVLNPTNRDWLLDRYGDDQRCVGKTVLIWHDPDVEYPRGKKVGGLRIADATEYPRDRVDQNIGNPGVSRAEFDDDIPFGND